MITALCRVTGRQGCFSLLAINYDRVDFDAGRQEALVAYQCVKEASHDNASFCRL
jgi:hypothetical protein